MTDKKPTRYCEPLIRVLLVKVAKLRARVRIFKAKNVGPVMRLFKGPRPMTSKRAQARLKKPLKNELKKN